VIFYLKDRLAAPLEELPVPSELDNDVLSVLMTLGYSVVEAQTAIQSIPENAPEEVEERVRIALQHFG
jgi:Holliday junction DNA helicase RuvA